MVIKSFSNCEGVGARAAKSPLAERGGGLGFRILVGRFTLPQPEQPPSRDARDGGVRDGAGEGSLSLRLRARRRDVNSGTPSWVFLRKVFKRLKLRVDFNGKVLILNDLAVK